MKTKKFKIKNLTEDMFPSLEAYSKFMERIDNDSFYWWDYNISKQYFDYDDFYESKFISPFEGMKVEYDNTESWEDNDEVIFATDIEDVKHNPDGSFTIYYFHYPECEYSYEIND